MKWNTQRKAVVAVLALAGAAFCVDRFVLGYGPRSAAAAVEAIATAASPIAPDAAPTRAVPLSKRIAALELESPGPEFVPVGDALCTPAAWIPLIKDTPQPAGSASASTGSSDDSFVVSSVFLGKGKDALSAARIDNKLIRVGQSIRGHTLLRIEEPRNKPAVVILSGPGGEIRVPLTLSGSNSNLGPDEPADPRPDDAPVKN